MTTLVALTFSALAAAAWAYLAVARGGFWRGREDDRAMHDGLRELPQGFVWPKVTAIVPARNEVELIGSSVGSLLAQRYPGELDVIVVDDHSDDGTAAGACRAAAAISQSDRLTVIAAPPLPPGWTGKCWAQAQGTAHVDAIPARNVSTRPADYLLLTDADIQYEPDAVAALVSAAVHRGRVLSSLMVKLRCESLAERAFIPAFVFFFQMIYPFAWVNEASRRTAAAAGGCMLVRRQALADAGGIAAIRAEVIDDCALGARLKRVGTIHLALGEQVRSLRACASMDAVRNMVVRSAYAQLGYSMGRLAFVVAAMLIVFISPVVATLAASGPTRLLGAAAWLSMALLFMPIARRYAVSAWWGFALPAIAAVYLLFTIESAVQHRLGRGGTWKGRAQAHAAATTTDATHPTSSPSVKAPQP